MTVGQLLVMLEDANPNAEIRICGDIFHFEMNRCTKLTDLVLFASSDLNDFIEDVQK